VSVADGRNCGIYLGNNLALSEKLFPIQYFSFIFKYLNYISRLRLPPPPDHGAVKPVPHCVERMLPDIRTGTSAMTKTPRWLKSALVTATNVDAPLPFARGPRRKPQSLIAPSARLAPVRSSAK
jgi:hypothetical protein